MNSSSSNAVRTVRVDFAGRSSQSQVAEGINSSNAVRTVQMDCAGRFSQTRVAEGIIVGLQRLGTTAAATATVLGVGGAGHLKLWRGEIVMTLEAHIEPRKLVEDLDAVEELIIEGAVADIHNIAGPRGVVLHSLKLIAEGGGAGSSGYRSIVGCVVGFDLDD